MAADLPDSVFETRIAANHSAGRTEDLSLGTGSVVGRRAAGQPGSVCPGTDLGPCDLSIIIPARNEERWLAATLQAAINACRRAHENQLLAEVIVVDNSSDDGTWELLQGYVADGAVRAFRLVELGAAKARNHGRHQACGRILVFVDADTHLPPDGLVRIRNWCDQHAKEGGITRLAGLDGGLRARLWWTFWEHVRRLPLPYAKAMPAVMFCTAAVFDEFGPFDEEVAIGEEWPILAGLYRRRPRGFVYDRSLTALTSSRRMERQPFGYLRTLLKYVWAILHKPGRIHYTDGIR